MKRGWRDTATQRPCFRNTRISFKLLTFWNKQFQQLNRVLGDIKELLLILLSVIMLFRIMICKKKKDSSLRDTYITYS